MKIRRSAAVAALTAAVCIPLTVRAASAATWTHTYSGGTGTNSLVTDVLTPNGSDSYSVVKSTDQTVMHASSSNTGSNLREVYWPAGKPAVTDSQVCATWEFQSSDHSQEGLAVRITNTNGDVRAVTVTKNVWAGVWWVFNVHIWNSASSPAFTQIAQFDYSTIVSTSSGTETPFPWDACVRAVGSTLWFKLWVPALEPMPSWSNPTYVRSTTIPSGYLNAGETGWYIGHIPAGGTDIYGDLNIWAYQ